jgi:hypothetical protein
VGSEEACFAAAGATFGAAGAAFGAATGVATTGAEAAAGTWSVLRQAPQMNVLPGAKEETSNWAPQRGQATSIIEVAPWDRGPAARRDRRWYRRPRPPHPTLVPRA